MWYAEHTAIGKRAAVKVLRPQFATQPNVVQRFISEARAASAIEHPNIVSVLDFGQEADLLWIVMELLQGETLGACLERERVLPEEDMVRIVGEAAKALAAAHAQSIIHRDLKPENIFLTRGQDGSDGLKILDFGIAKLADQSSVDGGTQTGMVIGTPSYMSPEQCVGDRSLDHRTDVYSLGVVTYEALAGAPPFEAQTFGGLIVAHTTQEPEPLRYHNRDVSEELAEVVHTALAKKPADRFETITEFAQALRAACKPGRKLTVQQKAAVEERQAVEVSTELLEIIRRKLASGKFSLPSMPVAVVQALEHLGRATCNFDDVAACLASDPLVSARVLRLVNSPVYGGRESVTDLGRAVRRLGIKPLRSLLVSVAARTVFRSKDARIRDQFQRIWVHCVATGLISKRVAHRLPRGTVDAPVANVAGLLHDIGKPVVAAFLLEAERQLLAEIGESWLSPGVWAGTVAAAHREVGVALVEQWSLPSEVREAVDCGLGYDSSSLYRNVVRYAEALATMEGLAASDQDGDATQVVLEGRGVLSFSPETEAELTEGIEGEVRLMTSSDRRSRADVEETAA